MTEIKIFCPCPVQCWIPARPAVLCIHLAYRSRGFSAGRDMANQQQSVTKFVMGANGHSPVVLVANLNVLLFFSIF